MKDGKLNEKLNQFADSGRLRKMIMIAGAAGIALILLSSVDFTGCAPRERNEEFSVKTYSTEIESDLESVISRIEGAGKTKVLLTM